MAATWAEIHAQPGERGVPARGAAVARSAASMPRGMTCGWYCQPIERNSTVVTPAGRAAKWC